ncbi:GNAT family N-acetyltransferase [Micromonospora sp. NPDC093277]|uniref:GNAT family N-acetyltransferase n=1 Tax=Micromonospora sp. NPDC093277 TaxID=3364291 RepID=UPI0038165B06
MAAIQVRPAEPRDEADVAVLHHRAWGGPYVVVHDTRYDLRELPTLVAVDGAGELAGALVHRLAADGLEVVSLAASSPELGAGSALLVAAEAVARAAEVDRLWLVTTNDKLSALRFYQRRGLRIVAVDVGAVDRARRLKPTIPYVGEDDIPLHDELLLERRLETTPRPR